MLDHCVAYLIRPLKSSSDSAIGSIMACEHPMFESVSNLEKIRFFSGLHPILEVSDTGALRSYLLSDFLIFSNIGRMTVGDPPPANHASA